MLRSRIRSALYIDFENVPLPPDTIGNWLAWLEDGLFDATPRRRRFLQKRVYWNSHAERNRALFQRHGFEAFLVGKYSGLKNGADIRMAMDVVEATYRRAEIDEFILLTGDSDFVPVLERLKEKSKRSAIVVTEHRPNIHTTYHRSADALIPSRRLTEAAQYRRPRPGLLARLLGRGSMAGRPARTSSGATIPAPPPPVRPSSGGERPPDLAVEHGLADPPPVLETAAKRIARLLMQHPRNYVAQKRVLGELDRVPGFKRQGPTAYFGTGSYKALMLELTRLDPRISVVEQPGGGTGVVHIPPLPPGKDASSASPPLPLPTIVAGNEQPPHPIPLLLTPEVKATAIPPIPGPHPASACEGTASDDPAEHPTQPGPGATAANGTHPPVTASGLP
jgi:hypothetical protein